MGPSVLLADSRRLLVRSFLLLAGLSRLMFWKRSWMSWVSINVGRYADAGGWQNLQMASKLDLSGQIAWLFLSSRLSPFFQTVFRVS